MDLGFETVGNATLIIHDRRPVLVTDPWMGGSAYFGSWGLSHEIPAEQAESVARAPWVWFSHGHPDHLNPGSLNQFRDHRVLVADHAGGRIASSLSRDGFDVTVLPDNQWVPLTDRVRVLCLADYNQDSALLIDVGGRLLVNMNDCTDRGWGGTIRRHIRSFPQSFMLRLSGYGDADMINFFDEQGNRITSPAEFRRRNGYRVGAQVAQLTDAYGTRFFIPFSSFHRYQRTDSAWANDCTTDVDAFTDGYESSRSELLPAFVRYDCTTDTVEEIEPLPASPLVIEPAEFGDDWDDELSPEESAAVGAYFHSIEHLGGFLEFVNVRVGGKDHVIPFGERHAGRGITFEVPRHSLLQAVEWEIFDDLLIGNFMRTTLHGRWPASRLSTEVTPYIAKYADNGRARTAEELRAYFAEYRRRMGPVRYLRHQLERRAKEVARSHLRQDSPALELATRTYQRIASHA
jgi:hypothetical protein